MLEYKAELGKTYAPASANGALAAVNGFLRLWGWGDCCVKPPQGAKTGILPGGKGTEPGRIRAAGESSPKRRAASGWRCCWKVYAPRESSERTAVYHSGGRRTREGRRHYKGKTRTVFLPAALQKKLRRYVQRKTLQSGPVFVTRTGKPLNRSNIWREMKALCQRAKVAPSKVFPHSLRHLFARTFYSIDHDVAKLADILGHSNINTTRIYIITTGRNTGGRWKPWGW
ncbi:MAG: tyrosine-type recombinase/integrase [Clostridia bacterium]